MIGVAATVAVVVGSPAPSVHEHRHDGQDHQAKKARTSGEAAVPRVNI